MIYIIGGNITQKMAELLGTIGVHHYRHVVLKMETIDRSKMREVAIKLRSDMSLAVAVLTIGPFAHKLAQLGFIDHFQLDIGSGTKQQINENLAACRQFLGERYVFSQYPSVL